ncbi:MAG: hypothetical protein ABI720_07165 [Actinomycetes bacterium]
MTLAPVPRALGVCFLAAALLAGCTASEPDASDSPEPTPSAASQLPEVGWGGSEYPVPCFARVPTVKFVNGEATYRGFQVTADVAARGELASYESVSIHVVCSGASGSPSSVLVYIAGIDGPEYVGLALSPKEFIDLKKAKYVRGELSLTGYGFTRGTPACCPDLIVTKTVALEDGKLVKTNLAKEPFKG